jgi:AmmeMemoRadiSam system protein A
MLSIARQAIRSALAGMKPQFMTPSERFRQHRGVFTTLHLGDELRGCVGDPYGSRPLFEAIAQTAISAAFYDPRFTPVTLPEWEHLRISLSLLSPMFSINPEQIETGRHGLLISRGALRGLLLPEVASQRNWTAEKCLQQTCMKAGLSPDAWKQAETAIEAFTTESFSE